ncbi:MAG: class I SAM-dependent methyltransferase [Patescibacteria group bacterium]
MQENVWEREYRDPKLVTLGTEATSAIKDFARYVRKERKVELDNLKILDLGCGNGKNSIYIAEQGLGNEVTGVDISETALEYARKAYPAGKFVKLSIGQALPFADTSFDIIIDSTSSNSLSEKEREVYLSEISRLLKPGGHLFVRALCKDGDKNAQTLIKEFPGPEKDTYIMPELGLTERVFSKEDLIALYSPLFSLLFIEKETHYTKFNNKSYKRNFWLSYWTK